ncbi:ATP dependent DNA ligase [Nocardia gipuzkoensis]
MVYVGHVGTGFTVAARRALFEQLKALITADSPFDRSAPSWQMKAARWVKPELVGTVEFRVRRRAGASELARTAYRDRR